MRLLPEYPRKVLLGAIERGNDEEIAVALQAWIRGGNDRQKDVARRAWREEFGT